jgi:hypothetical protein
LVQTFPHELLRLRLYLNRSSEDDHEESRVFYGEGVLEYLMGEGCKWHDETLSFPLVVGDMVVKRKGGYVFSCEFDATVKFPDGRRVELVLEDELPFVGVSMNVPINGNAVAIGHARAKREIGPLEVTHGEVIAHDWQRKNRPDAPVNDFRHVRLHTPWRQSLA